MSVASHAVVPPSVATVRLLKVMFRLSLSCTMEKVQPQSGHHTASPSRAIGLPLIPLVGAQLSMGSGEQWNSQPT
jgi:hypothetical protein